MTRPLPPLRAARAFEAAARHGSFSKAARELHLSQAAVSQQVKVLESWFGFSLFQRGQNSILLTDEAAVLLPALRLAFDTIAEVTEALRHGKGKKRIRLSMYPNLALNWLVPRLHQLRTLLPDVEIEITTSTEPIAELFNHCDLAIRPFEDASQFSFELLCSAEMFPVASPNLIGARKTLSPEEFVAYPLLHLSRSPEDWRLWFESVNVFGKSDAGGYWFDTQAVMIEAARKGLGIGLARSPFHDEAVASGTLVVLSTRRVVCNESWYVITPAALRQGRVATVRDWLLSQAQVSSDLGLKSD